MGIHELEYKRLLSELRFKNEELEIIEESMLDIHLGFEEYYANFLKENELSKQELESSNTAEFKNFQETVLKPQMPETDETGIVVVEQMSEEDKEAKVVFAKLYKDIVKKCHPDRLSQDDMEHFNKMNTKFKAASWAYNNAKWSILIRVASELNIKPMNYKKINGHLRKEIKTVDKEINKHKSTYGWKLYQAEEKEQKDNVIKDFIFKLFRRRM
jgi:hypothetical protein